MGDCMGTLGAAGTGLAIQIAQRKVDNVEVVEVCRAGVHLQAKKKFCRTLLIQMRGTDKELKNVATSGFISS